MLKLSDSRDPSLASSETFLRSMSNSASMEDSTVTSLTPVHQRPFQRSASLSAKLSESRSRRLSSLIDTSKGMPNGSNRGSGRGTPVRLSSLPDPSGPREPTHNGEPPPVKLSDMSDSSSNSQTVKATAGSPVLLRRSSPLSAHRKHSANLFSKRLSLGNRLPSGSFSGVSKGGNGKLNVTIQSKARHLIPRIALTNLTSPTQQQQQSTKLAQADKPSLVADSHNKDSSNSDSKSCALRRNIISCSDRVPSYPPSPLSATTTTYSGRLGGVSSSDNPPSQDTNGALMVNSLEHNQTRQVFHITNTQQQQQQQQREFQTHSATRITESLIVTKNEEPGQLDQPIRSTTGLSHDPPSFCVTMTSSRSRASATAGGSSSHSLPPSPLYSSSTDGHIEQDNVSKVPCGSTVENINKYMRKVATRGKRKNTVVNKVSKGKLKNTVTQ